MATEKQIEANRKNALLSTGAVTEEGKAVVSKNAVKHGIFTKDLVISSGDGRENEEEYREMLDNLIESLNPKGQIQSLLVEKIAVDFWRLRRVLRYETGSIRKYLDMAIYDYYNSENGRDGPGKRLPIGTSALNPGGKMAELFNLFNDTRNGKKKNKTNAELDEEIDQLKDNIDWNNRYAECLDKGLVSFDHPKWWGEGLESDIELDFYIVIDSNKNKILNEDVYMQYESGEFDFERLKAVLRSAGYTDKTIADELIKYFRKQNQEYERQIYDLEQKKLKNKIAEEVNIMLCSLPDGESAEKVMRYERAIQKSIFQNLAILKKLQSLP